jgi:hypothetical protein
MYAIYEEKILLKYEYHLQMAHEESELRNAYLLKASKLEIINEYNTKLIKPTWMVPHS